MSLDDLLPMFRSYQVDVGRGRRTPPLPARAGFGDPALQPKRKPVWLWVVLAVVVAVPAYLIFKPRRSPEEIGKLIADAQVLAASATKAAAAVPSDHAESRPEVARLLVRVHAVTNKTDMLRTELDTAAGLLEEAARIDPSDAAVWA